MSHFFLELPTDFKYQLMTSFCVQITEVIWGNRAAFNIRKVTGARNYLAEPYKWNIACLTTSCDVLRAMVT